MRFDSTPIQFITYVNLPSSPCLFPKLSCCKQLKFIPCSFSTVYVVFSEQSLAEVVTKYADTACTLSSSER